MENFPTIFQERIVEYSSLMPVPYVYVVTGNHECGFPFDRMPTEHLLTYSIIAELMEI